MFGFFALFVVLASQSVVFSQDHVLKLDGDGDYVNLGQPDFLPSAYTLEAKVYRTELFRSGLEGLISKDGRADGSGDWFVHWSIHFGK